MCGILQLAEMTCALYLQVGELSVTSSKGGSGCLGLCYCVYGMCMGCVYMTIPNGKS